MHSTAALLNHDRKQSAYLAEDRRILTN